MLTDEGKSALKVDLARGIVSVTFTKANGEERVMRCTVNEFEIPIEKLPKGTGPSHTDEVQRVFDVDKQEWRSFRWDNVTSFEV